MKILIVGNGHSELHEKVVEKSLVSLGHEVRCFFWNKYFTCEEDGFIGSITRFIYKFQNKYIIGPPVRLLNKNLIFFANSFRPDAILLYRGSHIYANTLRIIKSYQRNVVLVAYNNDDPFAKGHPYSLWRHFFRAVPYYDLVLAYRQHNIDDFRRIGANRVELLRSWFVPDRNHPVQLSEEEQSRYACDVVFVGHFEKDIRKPYLEELVRQGIRVNLFGPGYDWDPAIKGSSELRDLIPVELVWGEDYNKALCGAKIALCFLSRLNRDTYTRRCFEIPATNTLLLSEYTDDLASLYREGEEAEFFRDRHELVAKVKFYLENETLRESIAEKGCWRVYADGHDVGSRMGMLLKWVDEIRQGERKTI